MLCVVGEIRVNAVRCVDGGEGEHLLRAGTVIHLICSLIIAFPAELHFHTLLTLVGVYTSLLGVNIEKFLLPHLWDIMH